MSELMLILVCGLPGCGKSTIAKLLGNREGYPILSIDPIESGILRSGLERTKITEEAAYYVAENLAVDQLSLGISLIVDSVSATAKQKSRWIEIAHKFNAQIKVIECVCSDEKIQMQRINSRNRSIFGIPEISLSGIKEYESIYAQWGKGYMTLDAINDIEANYTKAVTYLESSQFVR